MNKVCQAVLGAVAFAAVSVGVVGEAKAVNPNYWGPIYRPFTSSGVSATEIATNTTTNHTVAVLATVFPASLSVSLTYANYFGSWENSGDINCDNGNIGADLFNTNIILFCPFGGFAEFGDALQAFGRSGLTAF